MPLFDICCMSSPIREATSTPYIPCDTKESGLIEQFLPSSSTDLKGTYEQQDYERSITRSHRGHNGNVRFNAGSVGGSTDMLNLIRLYQESDDKETVQHWMDIFTQNKRNQMAENVAEQSLEYDDYMQSNESHLHHCHKRGPMIPDELKARMAIIRSMDPLPPSKDAQGNLLEKCHSADYKHLSEDRNQLQRCQEMTNITDGHER